jgi:cytochrome c oxidase subunit 2
VKQLQFIPEQASNFAQDMDLLYMLLLALTLLFSLLVFVPLIYFAAKYRVGTRAKRGHTADHNLKLELAWSIIPLLMGLPVFVWASKLFVDMYTPVNSKDTLEIFVVGKQWMWQMQHPTGQRENNELHIPVNRPIKFTMISQDVIHDFFVPAFRMKKDVLPGRYATQWVTPTKVGRYHLFCAEYCGTKHSEMIGYVTVLSQADYEKWLREVQWGIGNFRPSETMEEAGERLFSEKGCVTCHSPGKSKQFVSLAGIYGTERTLDDGRRVTADDAYLRRSMLEPDAMRVSGFNPVMPSYKGVLDEQQVLQLIAFIRSMSKPANEGAAAAQVNPE